MALLGALLLAFALAASSACWAHFVVEKSSIKVLSPLSMRSRHDGAIGNFGVPKYGGILVGSVAYPDKDVSNGCEAFNGDKPFKPKFSRPTILLLDRGGCYFAKKVWNGQQAGAAAVLVADNRDEPLITMDSPQESIDADGYIEKIGIPSALIERSFGESLKQALKKDEEVIIELDWRESMPHPDERVEYEFWTNSNDECGNRCDEQMNFVKNFKGHAQILEKRGYTLFTPHYITWYCPPAFVESNQCKSQCINRGRYCAPDPEQVFGEGYDGKDVSNRSWVWWDYVTDFHIRCSMKEKKYSKDCAEDVIKSLGLPIDKIKRCMGDPEADVENEVLKIEQELQVGRGSRGDVTILPTLVINNVQYRGLFCNSRCYSENWERTAVLQALCAGFKEGTDPPVCLSADLETNECVENNGGCWQDVQSNVTACKDTFRGRVCKCPSVQGVQYKGDGYMSCEAFGPGWCAINNGGCWLDEKNGRTFSACSESQLSGCSCPHGFRGDGHKCEDVDECKERSACQCDGCSCKNIWGGYDCKCKGNHIYIAQHDSCTERNGSRLGWFVTVLVLAAVAGVAIAGYIFYKYRLQSYMDSEIMATISRYMPLDNHHPPEVQTDVQPLRGATRV
ncbi:hypothetical protein NL676_007794 [Syzygium grande]|nr:hypothetical protein NL676_007794 [Syzygium grande]